MLALRTATTRVSGAEAAAAASSTYGIDGRAEPLAGERDQNFRLDATDGRRFVLKLLDVAESREAIRRQAGVLRYLETEHPSLAVPRLVTTREGTEVGSPGGSLEGQSTLLISYLGGQPLGEQSLTPQLLRALGATVARLDRALQGFCLSGAPTTLAWDIRCLPALAVHAGLIDDPALGALVEAAAARIAGALPALSGLRHQAIHGDCHGTNVLVDAAAGVVTGIVDFGDMIHAPLIMEIAVVLAELLCEGRATLDDLDVVLQAYARVQVLQAAEIERLYELVTARLAIFVLVHAWRCRHDTAGAAPLDVAAGHAGQWLQALGAAESATLTARWHTAAATSAAAASLGSRRQRLLGRSAELFYERPLHLVRGEGAWLFDANGRRYLDVYNNVPHVGHANPVVNAAIARQGALLNTHTRYLHERVLDYAEGLTSRLPAHLDTCIFVNSGSEANDVAWRMAQFATGQQGGLVLNFAYHGITAAVAALTPSVGPAPDPRIEILASPPGTLRVHDVPDAAQLSAALCDADAALARLRARGFAPAAYYLDSALTSSGIFDPPSAWLAASVTRARAAGALLVADEVQYGLGRSGSHFWGFERRGVVPDIVTLGKPVGNGFPLGVVISNRRLIDDFTAAYGFFSTFGGNPVAAAAGLAVLEVLDREQLQAHAGQTGHYLRTRLEALSARHASLGQVRGAGLMLGLEVLDRDGQPNRRLARRCVNLLAEQHAILTGTEGPAGAVLKLRPPMVFSRDQADLLADAIGACAAVLDQAL